MRTHRPEGRRAHFLKLKRNENGRFQRWLDDHAIHQQDDETTAWEQNEYFDFF